MLSRHRHWSSPTAGAATAAAGVQVLWFQVYHCDVAASWPYTVALAYSIAAVPVPPGIGAPFSCALPAASIV